MRRMRRHGAALFSTILGALVVAILLIMSNAFPMVPQSASTIESAYSYNVGGAANSAVDGAVAGAVAGDVAGAALGNTSASTAIDDTELQDALSALMYGEE